MISLPRYPGFAILVAFSVVFPLHAAAESSDDPATGHILAEGVGRTADEAQVDAWRNAVSQVVGAMVDTETLVKNEKLVSDKVLTYSRGYIERFTILSTTEFNGLFRVRIEAWVKKMQLREKLAAIQILDVATDGRSIAAQIKTRQEMAQNASLLLSKALEPFVGVQQIKIVDVTQGDIDVREDGASISYRVRIGIDEVLFTRFRQDLVDVLKNVGTRCSLNVPDETVTPKPRVFRDVVRKVISHPSYTDAGPGHIFRDGPIIPSGSPLQVIIQDGGDVQCYLLEPGTFPLEKIQALAMVGGIKLRVRLFDSGDDVVAASPWQCLPDGYKCPHIGERLLCSSSRVCSPDLLGWVDTWDPNSWGGPGDGDNRQEPARIRLGITNLILKPDDDRYNAGFSSFGEIGDSVTVELKVAVDSKQAQRVVRAEAQVLPYPNPSPLRFK